MFMEPRPRTAPKLRRSETLVPERAHFAPLEQGSSFHQRVYKHFAALRRGQILVHNFRDTTPDSQQSEFQRPKTKDQKCETTPKQLVFRVLTRSSAPAILPRSTVSR